MLLIHKLLLKYWQQLAIRLSLVHVNVTSTQHRIQNITLKLTKASEIWSVNYNVLLPLITQKQGVRHSKPRFTPHCRVLPCGKLKFDSTMWMALPIYSESLTIIAVMYSCSCFPVMLPWKQTSQHMQPKTNTSLAAISTRKIM